MASNSKKRRRVLGASCILAALIIASSSFAWFTSKDEVTNRLSASANYGVSIAEDFTPPENWLPGQKVDKNVGVVNTGNVDAFVRTWLEGEMNVLAEKRDTQKWVAASSQFSDGTNATLTSTSNVDSGAIANLTPETDNDLISYGLTYYYGTGATKVSLKELSTTKYLNPNNPTNPVSSPDGYSEVMSVQAGGQIAYVSNAATSFKITPNQTSSFKSSFGDTYDVVGGVEYTVSVDSSIKASDSSTATDVVVTTSGTTGTIKVTDLAALYKYVGANLDTNTFKPITTGLYLFRRNSNLTNASATDYEFSGYYYVAKKDSDTGAEGKFFALQYENDGTQRSDYVLEDTSVSVTPNTDGTVTVAPTATLALYTANKQVVENTSLIWKYTAGTKASGTEVEENGVAYVWKTVTDDSVAADGWYNGTTALNSSTDADLIARLNRDATNPATLTASWVGVDGTSGNADDIKVTVNLNNIGTDAEKWTAWKDAAHATTAVASWGAKESDKYTFYYNNDVEEGATTAQLVDSLELDKNTTKNAYIAFDFDLNVFMESQQITIADDGKESGENIAPWSSSTNATAAKGTITNVSGGSEIESIAWGATT